MRIRKIIFLVVSFVTLGLTSLFAQDQYCEKPQYAPKKDKHENCMDALGRRQGLWKSFSYYGYLTSEITWKDSKMNGASIIYYATTGKVRERANYFDGKKDGEYTTYFFNGQTNAEGEYDYGKKVGTWTYYYSTTGETRMTGNYVVGKRDGDWKYYTSKGVLLRTVTFKNGETVSTTYPPKPGSTDGPVTIPAPPK